MQELTAWKFHCGLPKSLACGDSTGNIARLNQTFSDLLHFQEAPMTQLADGVAEFPKGTAADFRQSAKRAKIADQCSLKCVAGMACKFGARVARTARKI